jgi:hypothetical protein
MKNASDLIYYVMINTDDVHLKTGPKLFGTAISMYTKEECDNFGKLTLLPPQYFYWNKVEVHTSFGCHMFKKEW